MINSHKNISAYAQGSFTINRVKYSERRVQTLVEQFKKDDKKAFAEIWQTVMPIVRRLLRRGLDADTAEHLTGDVCLRLFGKGIYEYDRQKSSFITWVYTTALNLKIDELKRVKPILFSQLPAVARATGRKDLADINNLQADYKSPLRILIEREEAGLRQRALELLPLLMEQLSPDEQYVIYASVYEERGDKDISLILEGDETHCKKYQKMRERALHKLGRMFAEHGIRRI
jgi:RNA polymerase sigma factor (sigma-70 family)